MEILKSYISMILTSLIFILGGYDNALLYLIIVIVGDYITGILKAIKNKKLNSEIGRKGIIKKVGFFVLVGLSFLIDNIINTKGLIRNIVIYYIIANEGLSILENLGSLGIPIPPIIVEKLEQLRNEKENKK